MPMTTGHKNGRNPVGQFLDRRFAALGFFHQADDLRQRGLFADLGGLKLEQAQLVERCADHRVAGPLFYRQRFAGQHRFVHRRAPFDHDAVHRDLLARAHHHHVADPHLIDRHFHLTARRGSMRAVLARSPISFLIASLVRPLARTSRNLPSLISVMITAAVSK